MKSSACGQQPTVKLRSTRIKSRSESHERVVAESDLILSA